MLRTRTARPAIAVVIFAAILMAASSLLAQTSTDKALAWFNAHQNADGTWGAMPELAPRDTARVLIAQAGAGAVANPHDARFASFANGVAWLGTQRGFTANQFLAEQGMALAQARLDATATLAQLAQQRSSTSADYGSFADFTGDTLDSALAMQAFATNTALYSTAISGALTTLITRQNPDGGWGIDRGFDSNRVLTAEVLIALSSTSIIQAPPAVIAAAQAYLLSAAHPDGSIGSGVLETATAFRALALSGGAVNATTITYLQAQQLTEGSWSGDPYLTARVLDAFTANKPNLTINAGDFTLTPSQTSDGSTVTANVKVTNKGAVQAAASTLTLYLGDATGRSIKSVAVNALAPGASQSLAPTFTASQMVGTQTISAVADATTVVSESREDDNTATATLVVSGKPDLLLFAADITTSPARLQPNQSGTLSITIRNNGDGDASAVGYAVYDTVAPAPEVQLAKSSVASIPARSAEVVSLPITLAGGSHVLRIVVDPDNAIAETDETNNQASKSVSVNTVSNVDLRIRPGNVTATPSRPNAGDSVTITAIVENAGTDPTQSTVAFFDGVPGAGGNVLSVLPITVDAQSAVRVQAAFTATATSRVVYAVADPDNLLPEIDETNNQSFATLTDQYADLSISRDGFVLTPKTPLASGSTLQTRLVVRNNGLLPATGVEVVIYDDLPRNGGNTIVDTFVDVPAQGKVVVPASWAVRAGQRFATAVVNPSHAVFEPDYSNNRVTKLYTANGTEGDLSLYTNGSVARTSTVDTTQLVVSTTDLTVGGVLRVTLNTPTSKSFNVALFEDVDGDGAFNPEIDSLIGSTLVQPATNPQVVSIVAAGTVRFAPGKLMIYVDSTNAVAESHEENNIIDVWQDCSTQSRTFSPGAKWTAAQSTYPLSPVARVMDTNGDDVIDENDAPFLVQATGGSIALRRGDTGAVVWSQSFGYSGRQISPVIADVDGDGKAEILAHDYDHRLVALNLDGTRKWTSPQLDRDPSWEFYIQYVDYSYGGAPIVADLDGDGFPEVISGRSCLDGRTGAIKWVGTGGAGRAWDTSSDHLYGEFFPDQEAPIAVDLNGDGKLEVVAGNTAYRYDGTILWQRSDLSDGYTAAVMIPGRTLPSICLVGQGRVWMLNNDGTTAWGPISIPGGAMLGGAPTVFMDGGSGPWVGVAGDVNYTVFNATTGAQRWTKQVNADTSFGYTVTNSATAFDFGAGMDLVYSGHDRFVILRASDGAEIYKELKGSNAFYPMSPVVADIDGDGRADVVVPGRNQLKIMSDPTWGGAPSSFNEAAYHVVNVNSDGFTIPKTEPQTSFSRVHYRAQTSVALSAAVNPLPNVTASYMRADTSQYPASASLIVRVGNNGMATATPVTVTFYRVETNGSSTPIGTTTTGVIAPGAYEDDVFTISSPTAGTFTYYAVADSDNKLGECNSNDNQSANITVRFSADIAINPTSLYLSDPQPRQTDVVTFGASASLNGAIDASQVVAQFFLGDPAAGGTPISGVLPVILSSMRGMRSVSVQYNWTVDAPIGVQTVYVKFDPANAIVEDDETNNSGAYAVNVSGSDPIQKLEGVLTLDPPAAESGTPINITVLLHNIGNVPLSSVVLNYAVTGGAGTGFTGTVSIASIAKNAYQSVPVGSFTPAANGTYTVTLTAADPAVTLLATPKSVKVAPFAGAELTAVPLRVPISLPVVQCHTRIARSNTIPIPDDPMIDLIKRSLQSGVNWEGPTVKSMMGNCYRCHIQAQGLAGLAATTQVSGVTVDQTLRSALIKEIIGFQNADGSWYTSGYWTTATASATWALSYASPAEVMAPLIKGLDYLLTRQDSDGGYSCDDCRISFSGRETPSMMSMIALSRGYEMTQKASYRTALTKLVNWALNYNYQATKTTGPEYAARVAIGLAHAIPELDDPVLKQAATTRQKEIVLFLHGLENPDGTFGTLANPEHPVLRTSQCLYAMALAGTPGTDAGLRASILWLINNQRSNGGWVELDSEVGSPQLWFDESTWALIAMPAAFLRLGQFDVDYTVTLPTDTTMVSFNVAASSSRATAAGQELTWHLPDVTETGTDLYFNVRLNALAANQTRPVTGPVSIAYTHPYTGDAIRRDVGVPSVTGYAPLTLDIATDKPAYAPSTNVTVTETIGNAGSTNDAITNDLVIRDANGMTVATVATADPVQGLPPEAFPGWHYSVPGSSPVTYDGVGRIAVMPIDFAQKLAAAGVSGTFDRNSIRVSADSAPSNELYFTWLPSATDSPAGQLLVTVPDAIGTGSTFAFHVFFDIIENGYRPASMFDRSTAGGATGAGMMARYYRLNTTLQTGYVNNEDQVRYYEPADVAMLETNTYLGSNFPAGIQRDYFVTIWSGALFAPTTGTYSFELGSDDGSWLDIDGVQIINNGGGHGVQYRTASIPLTAGMHRFKVTMFEWTGGEYLSWRWAPPAQGYAAIPPQYLYPNLPVADPSAVVVGPAQILPAGSVVKTYVWNTGTTAAAAYTAAATIRQYGSFITSGAAPFTITPAANVSGSVATDKPIYDSGDTVHVTGSVSFSSGNTTLKDLDATLSVVTPAGATIAGSPTHIATLVPGQTVNASFDWPAGTSPAGTYHAALLVNDSTGAKVADGSVPFDIRPTATSGKGVSGTITAPASVQQGESLPISVTITNAGNSALVDAPFSIRIIDPSTQSLAGSIDFTASLDAAATLPKDLSFASAQLKVQTYEAYLVSLITGQPVPLAHTTFEVKVPPLKLDLSIDAPARVLIWANCSPGNSTTPCTAVAPPFLTHTLDAAHIPWTLVGEETAFITAMRSGAYDEAIVYQPGAFEAKIAAEYLEVIRSGFGLLFIDSDPDAMPKLSPALATSFRGNLNAQSTALQLLDTPFTSAGTLTLNGNGVNIVLDGAKAAATIAATQAPAISYNTFGSGRVVVVPFDTELTPTDDVARLLLGAVQFIDRTDTFEARRVVPIDFTVTPPPTGSVNLTVAATLPAGMTIVFAQPALTTTASPSWNFTANGDKVHLYLWVRLPETAGTYTITGTAAFQGQTPVVTKTIDVTVTADRAALESALDADLAALVTAAPSNDAHAVNDAVAQLKEIRAATPADDAQVLAVVDRVMTIIGDLQSVSIDTATARSDADRLLLYWQSRAAL